MFAGQKKREGDTLETQSRLKLIGRVTLCTQSCATCLQQSTNTSSTCLLTVQCPTDGWKNSWPLKAACYRSCAAFALIICSAAARRITHVNSSLLHTLTLQRNNYQSVSITHTQGSSKESSGFSTSSTVYCSLPQTIMSEWPQIWFIVMHKEGLKCMVLVYRRVQSQTAQLVLCSFVCVLFELKNYIIILKLKVWMFRYALQM